MKTIKYFFLLSLGLFFTISCDTNDDGFYNTVYLQATDLVEIETQPSYSVGDKLYINADFSRYQDEPGHTEKFDIYKTTNAEEFNFSYILQRKNNLNNWELIEIPTSQLNIIKGNAVSGLYVFGSCLYNAADESYEYNVGIPLLQSGEYRLSYGYFSGTTNSLEIYSKSPGFNISLTIYSTTNDTDSQGFYNFTVN